MAIEPAEKAERPKLDKDTDNLLALWGVLEYDQTIKTVSGELGTKIIVAALTTGIVDKKQVEVVWQHEKTPQPPKVALNQEGNKVTITIDKNTLTEFENEIESKLMPGEVTPYVDNPEQYLIEAVKSQPATKRTGLDTLAPINQALIEAYNFYQGIK